MEEVEVDEFLARYPVDERARDFLLRASPEVQSQVIQEFKPKKEGDSDYSALLITFTKRHMEKEQRSQPSQLELFLQKYPVDEKAHAYLVGSSPEVQHDVISNFKAKREGEEDYSAIVITFTKRCRDRDAQRLGRGVTRPMPAPAYYPPAPPQAYHAPPPVYHQDIPPWRQGTGAGSWLRRDLEDFFLRYPVDERAYRYVMESEPHVQEELLRGFQAKREGERDYSAIVISFTKKCRGMPPAGVHSMGPPAQAWAPAPSHHGGWGLDRELHDFRARFPMDDRAFAYLAESPLPAQREVLDTFRPPREDTDYSALIINLAKKCRARAPPDRGHGNMAASNGYGPPVHYAQPSYGGGYSGGYGGGYGAPPPRAPPRGELDHFARRYPIDERAFAYLSDSSPDVIHKVLSEFKPKHEGESDYSGAVVSFVKRCRSDFSGGAGRSEPNAKRARYG